MTNRLKDYESGAMCDYPLRWTYDEKADLQIARDTEWFVEWVLEKVDGHDDYVLFSQQRDILQYQYKCAKQHIQIREDDACRGK